MLTTRRQTGRVNLGEAGIGKSGSALVRTPDRRDIARFRVGRQVEDIAVTARSQHDRIGRMRFDFSGQQIARDDASRSSIHQHEVEHLVPRIHLHRFCADLAFQRLVRAQEQLLTGLPARVKRA